MTSESIEKFSREYKNSIEEKDDVLAAYEKFTGKWSGIYETVMLSDMLKDEQRFRGYIDEAIASGKVEGYKTYTEETEKQREARMEKARRAAAREAKEAKEAKAEAEKLGASKKGGKKDKNEDSLLAIIRSRQAERSGAFMDAFAEKWGAQEKKPKGKAKKGKKRVSEDEDEDAGMPSEEAFQAAAAKLKGAKSGGEASEGRKAKRAKR